MYFKFTPNASNVCEWCKVCFKQKIGFANNPKTKWAIYLLVYSAQETWKPFVNYNAAYGYLTLVHVGGLNKDLADV